jgi:hypothetical protein
MVAEILFNLSFPDRLIFFAVVGWGGVGVRGVHLKLEKP